MLKPRLPSALSRALRRGLALTLVLAAFMLANTVYLVGVRMTDAGEPSTVFLPVLLQVMVLAHTVAGLVLVVAMLAFLVAHLPRVWKRYHPSSAVSGAAFVIAGLTLAVSGLFILTEAASRNNAWAWWLHVGMAVAAPVGYGIHRLTSRAKPRPATARRFIVVVGGLVTLLAVGHVLSLPATRISRSDGDQRTETHDRYIPPALPSPSSPYYPSAAAATLGNPAEDVILSGLRRDTVLIREEATNRGFTQSVAIGAEACVRCHADVTTQWETSAHRFSSFNNPFYEAVVNVLLDTTLAGNPGTAVFRERHPRLNPSPGPIRAQFCAACHDPALLFSGRIISGVDRASPAAQAGLTCQACHAIDSVMGRTGNGNYALVEKPDPYLFAGAPPGSIRQKIHDAALRARPEQHRRRMLTEQFRGPQFCSTCHKVSLPEVVNDYRWVRGQNEFDAWDDSGVSLNAARTFYLPETRRVCQDCHMPPETAERGDLAARDGTVRSHRFTAVNSALPFIRGDTAAVRRIENFLRSDKLSVDIFAASVNRGEATLAIGDSLIIGNGSDVMVDVVVRNLGVGHTFPGGTNDSNEGWLEFTIVGADGNIIAASGLIGASGHLDSLSHVYRTLPLDEDGNPVSRRNAQDQRTLAFANTIPPGAADVSHYRFRLDADPGVTSVVLRARLLWRKFNRTFSEFAFSANPEGFARFSEVPELPVTEIAVDSVVVRLTPRGDISDGSASPTSQSSWVRYNDWAIASLREGDTRKARRGFVEVARLKPGQVDGELNLARVSLAEGDLASTYDHLERAEAVRGGNARVAWVWARAFQEDGHYDQAVDAYETVLLSFPGDRATLRNLGRTLYLAGLYAEAVSTFDRVLAIDPEDRISHYHKMLSYRAMGDDANASLARQAYEYYQIDESAAAIARRYLRENPGANIMSQQIRVHPVEARH